VTRIDAKGSSGCVAIRPFALPSCKTARFARFAATARGWILRSGSIRISSAGCASTAGGATHAFTLSWSAEGAGGFVIEWVPRSGSGGGRRGFCLSLFVLRLHDAGRLPPGYLETSFWGGVIRKVIPPPSPAFPARLKRLLRRALALPAQCARSTPRRAPGPQEALASPFSKGRGGLTTFVYHGILWAERGSGEPPGNSGAGGVR
jgi:hypothetical protein